MTEEVAKYGNTDFTDADFDAAMGESEAAGVPAVRLAREFVVKDVPTLTLLVGELQFLRQTAANIRAQADAIAARNERLADWLEQHHRVGMEAVLDVETTGKKAKSIKLMTGQSPEPAVVGRRAVKGGLRIVDKDAALLWAKESDFHNSLVSVEVVEKPIAAAFKQYYEDMGEIPPGCEVVADEDRFYVKA